MMVHLVDRYSYRRLEGSCVILLNIGNYLAADTAWRRKNLDLQQHSCENLKSCNNNVQ